MKKRSLFLASLALTTCMISTGALANLVDEPIVLFEQDGVKATLTGETEDGGNCAIINVVVENNTDKHLDIEYTGTMNGWSFGNFTLGNASDIKPGSKAKGYLWFMFDDFDLSSNEDVETMDLTFTVKDGESYETLFEVETGEINFSDPMAGAQAGVSGEAAAAEENAAGAAEVETASAAAEPNFVFHTESAATEADSKYETLSVGSSGEAVVRLQEALIEKGVLTGTADGQYGNGTAAAVSAFQESAEIPATGSADSTTQEVLYGEYVEPEVNVAEALQTATWLFNGGENHILNGISFTDTTATIAQVYFDGNGKHESESNAFPYVLDDAGIHLTLLDGSEMEIAYEVKNGQLVLNNGEWKRVDEVKAGLQGNWTAKYSSSGMTVEHHVVIEGNLFRSENANSNYYYYGPYEGNYELNFGGFDAEFMHAGKWFYNIIDGEVTLMYYDHLFERTEEGLKGQNGYSF
ncbi:MAG: peptidoglycan-binding domain-containing protein [Lachnospiraceae bacterium]|nr:peptidoglycan-binding domain-containing protein [Lachnospiraceae bacterium]